MNGIQAVSTCMGEQDLEGGLVRDTGGLVMGEHEAEVWVSDCLSSQLKAPAKERQFCLSHQLRNLQAVVEQYLSASWARLVQALFRYAIYLHHQRESLPEEIFSKKRQRLETLVDKLLARSSNSRTSRGGSDGI